MTKSVGLAALIGLSAMWTPFSRGADFTVSEKVLRPVEKVVPLGANNYGGGGSIEWAANNFITNSGNEPIYWKHAHRAAKCGDNWFELDGPGTSHWDLWASGFLSGANLRIYRLVDKEGNPLPPQNNYLDISKADHVMFVGNAQVIPEGSPGYPYGGWIVGHFTDVCSQQWIHHGNLSTTDSRGLEPGRAYYYTVVAADAQGQESEPSNEVSATTGTSGTQQPHIVINQNEDKVPDASAGQPYEFTPTAVGGTAPLAWKADGLPEGLSVDPASGKVSGKVASPGKDVRFELHVTDAKGAQDHRWYTLNQTPPVKNDAKLTPPTDLSATSDGTSITLTWKASTSPATAFYRIKRSVMPPEKRFDRVYLSAGAPKLSPFDYIFVEKRFSPFSMSGVNSRVRGIGNPFDHPAFYWSTEGTGLSMQIVDYKDRPPAEMGDAGESYFEVTADAGPHLIRQITFIGTAHGGESKWYGQLEPGKKYHAEFWLRQQDLGNRGKVTFSFGKGYPELHQEWTVTDKWQKYTYDFTGPERPVNPWHFGQTLEFTGPGKLCMDNCRIMRVDDPADVAKPYVPNATVLNELLASQPESGPKGAHRVWFLNHNATMNSILSFHANSTVSPDWYTSVSGTMEMTLPMALTFDEHTGATPQERMRPWFVIQHMLHSEEDWNHLIEYLAAPYDPAKDSPQTKPWAYRRFQQRGKTTPWTDEFSQIIIEFGNETWHNGAFPDWLGFNTYGAVTQGGPEYGFFTRYLIENMKKSPYWASGHLDSKIRFDLGAFYNGNVEKDGTISGYGEEAMQKNPYAQMLGHANYVGPKWETGQPAQKVFSDDGMQTTLLSFVQGLDSNVRQWSQARDAMSQKFHDYDLAAYEGGPGGYSLPGSASPEQVEVSEKYGKSLAMAVGTMDAWLSSYQYGYTYQCFLAYGQGQYWNSHTDFSKGFRAAPAWLALAMRNRYASGAMVAVDPKNVPTINGGGTDYPLLGCYAMHEGKVWDVFVLSRKLDGALPASIQLPIDGAAKITLHKLAGDPRLTNREKLNVSIQNVDVAPASLQHGKLTVDAMTGGVEGGMPPGSIYLYTVVGR